MGGKKTTVVNETGIGDQQYQDLTAGQQTLMTGQETLGSNQAAIAGGIDQLSADATTQFGNLTTGQEGLAAGQTNILAGQTGLSDQLTTAQQAFADQLAAANDARAAAEQQAASAAAAAANAAAQQAAALSGLQSTVGEGFATQTGRFDQVDLGLADAQTNRQQFFDAATQQRADNLAAVQEGQAGITEQVLGSRDTLMAGQQSIRDNLSATELAVLERQQAAQDYLENLANSNQAANLEQQVAIQNLVNTYGGNLDAYYQDLAASNVASAERQGLLQTGLDTFRADQEEANTLNQQQQASLMDSVVSGDENLTNTIAQAADTLAAGQSGLMSASEQAKTALTDDIADIASRQAVSDRLDNLNFAEVSQLVTAGFQSEDPAYTEMKDEFTDRLTFMQNLISDENANISSDLRNTFNTMVDSFDAQGALIAQSNIGNDTIRRAIDQQGDLFLARFNQFGERTAQGTLNINQLMGSIESLGYVPGSSQNMASMSGTQQSGNTRFNDATNPAAQTVG